MAKRPPRLTVQYEKDQSGCMWGFISMFDFRHGRSTRRMIADATRSSQHAVGAVPVPTKNKFETLSDLDEEYQGHLCSRIFQERGESMRLIEITDPDKPSMKKLIEEEMFIEKDAVKDLGHADQVESKKSRVASEVSPKTDSKRKKKSRKKSRDMDTQELNSDATLKSEFLHNPHSRQQSKDNLDLDKIMEDFCHVKGGCSVMHDNDSEVNSQSNQNYGVSENLARDAIHEFVNQMIANGKDQAEDGKSNCSNELMEALQVISSDKELFVRLLQESDSILLKHVQELGNSHAINDIEHSSVIGSKFSVEEDLDNPKQEKETFNRKHRNFFRKRSKSQSEGPTNENGKTEFTNRIVILKPALTSSRSSGSILASSLDSHDVVHHKGRFVKVSSHFSLTEIKRKLKHAMGREKHGNAEGISRKLPDKCQNKGPGSKTIGKDNNVGMRSPTKDHFFMEKIARPMFDVMNGNKTGPSKHSEFSVEHENDSSKQRVSNLYIEARKHLCEMLDSGDENTNISGRQSPKTLGRILSIPEYNFSPLGSPGRDLEHHFVTTKTRFSVSDRPSEVNQDNLSPKQATFVDPLDQATSNSEKQSSICEEISNNEVQQINSQSNLAHDVGRVDIEETCSPVIDETVTEVNVESEKETDILQSSPIPVGFVMEKEQYCVMLEISDSTQGSSCLNQVVTEDVQPSSPPLSPSHSSVGKKIEELESVTDVSGRPSPVSVLDTPFLDEDSSPGYLRCQAVKLPVRPLQFDECDSSPVDQHERGKYCFEENELIYDYIKAVLQASSLTPDQLLVKCLSSDEILDPSLFAQIEFFPNPLCHDQKLLFDCIEEILVEVCWYYFGVSPYVSFVNPSIRPTPNMKRLTLKVFEGVCWHILPLPPPRTLEQIVRKDLAGSETWMDLRPDAETVGFEMCEVILAELMEDTIWSFISEIPESECSQLQLEADNESTINL
ncbi:uncharacterized protein [Arachis hypogaea]|uniref:uncharacterized protein isoform X1 n=1 Tax=Arachis hypogaea TaxID=3818 RepID=UPI000DEC68EE|nr:uncharacterized protein LOC112797463 isoform X1 [Arachis hypogaea]XP_025696191.1 uncharacterized protein LOC112797463 isoform X1 [Arachis hypogaea]